MANLQFTVLVKPPGVGQNQNGPMGYWRAGWLWSRDRAILCELDPEMSGKVTVDASGNIALGVFGFQDLGPEPYVVNRINGDEPRLVGLGVFSQLVADPHLTVTPTVAPWPW